MNWILLDAPPENEHAYVEVREEDTLENTLQHLRLYVLACIPQLKALNFDIRILRDLRTEVVGRGYAVQCLPTTPGNANFYLEKR